MYSASIFATTVSDHEVQIFYEADGIDPAIGPRLRLAALAGDSDLGIPHDQKAVLTGRYRDEWIWTRASKLDEGQDFHPHIRDIVGGRRQRLATFWMLDDVARRFMRSASLHGKDRDTPYVRKRLALAFSKAARRRLSARAIDTEHVIVTIEAIRLALFDTRHGFAMATIGFSRPNGDKITAIELLEAQVAITRFGDVRWVEAATLEPVAGDPFALGGLVRRLALGDLTRASRSSRVVTYTYARFETPLTVPERDFFANHLARRYSTDYMVSPDIQGIAVVGDFETVRHAVAAEGAATIVGPTDGHPRVSAFLEHYKTATFRRHYVPIALLALHEHAFLIERTSSSVVPETELKELLKIQKDSVFFRLCYSFSEVSYITMHNAFNRAFRQVLNLDRMHDKLTSDLAEVGAHLRTMKEAEERRLEQDRHRRFYWVSVVGGSALAGLTSFTITKEIIGALALHDAELARWAGAGVALVVTAAAAIVGHLKGPGRHEHEQGDDLKVEDMLDRIQVIKEGIK